MSAIPFPGGPQTTPAVPSKTFPHVWVQDLVINARAGWTDASSAYAAFVAYNANTGERLPQSEVQVREALPELYANVASFAAALDAMTASLTDVVAYIAVRDAQPQPGA